MRSLLLLLCLVNKGATLVVPPHARATLIAPPHLRIPSRLPILRQQPRMNAAVLPVAYTGLAATLAFRATQAATRGHVAVLASTAALALVDLGPTAAAQLASAKRATKQTQAANEESRLVAESWRSLVRLKIVGQLVSLLFMASTSRQARTLLGATCLLATNLGFWLRGAAASRHNAAGVHEPLPEHLTKPIMLTDGLLCALALFGSVSPYGTRRMSLLSKCFSMGILLAVFENVPGFVMNLPVILGLKPATPLPEPPPSAEG